MKQKSIFFIMILILFGSCKKEEIENKYMIHGYADEENLENQIILEINESEVSYDTLVTDSVYTISKSKSYNIDTEKNTFVSLIKFQLTGTWIKRKNGTHIFTKQIFVIPDVLTDVKGALNSTEILPWALYPGDYVIGSKDWKNEQMLMSTDTKYYIPYYNDSIVLDSISKFAKKSFVAFRLPKEENVYNYGWIEVQVIDYKRLVINGLTYNK